MSGCVACKTLDRVRAITRVVQPSAIDTRDLSQGTQGFWGPFMTGAIVRIGINGLRADGELIGAFWRPAMSPTDAEAASPTGARSSGLFSWQWVDVEITRDEVFISIVPESEGAVGTASVWITTIVRGDRGGVSGP